ncbi:MAG: hypothetical protein COZ07_10065 [Candidatus Infernicultor aquiphilus]|uniref:Type I restriction modification DNA specificity domain-containing protein n=1 Tax=Candidatus Infernicultor aquiphilus TaxID=1805029 RepID=A0A2M7PKU6_9BACT|nr:MAG: hypothetical protein COT11_04470 [Candidatus Atribacteria bacterium CG08_land_8_20_14_0_20_33_29]PIW12568.1 MAG: hypothetical protein COW35_00760 [Candidatus Atribacteria bacterium CG17_big_fil_post_rev_8_21_14_2_50_34_11]PIX34589.1 MAG: hypothetical protein COZ58_03415 [Candidatus Atribacteria bacterium CG_4_8_14_3_um_filter_34_18]PIY31218.1 MAG: hypothetical protein COZ07_10065 [Candidatus Atribacteria bacterium CG_4_10_14_3_um_filter_34_13]
MKTKAVIENGFKKTGIGLIPEDWEVVNVDKYIQFERGTEPGSENYNKDKKGVRFLRVVDISGSRDDKTYTTSKKLKLCKKKDILITFDGSPGIVKQGLEGAYSSGIRKVVIINKDLFSDYVYYVLQTIYVQKTIEKYTTGVTIKHSSKAILHIKIPFFSIQEQQKIAFVLLKIQQAIEQQDRIIETTRELKKSLMNKLFTEGLHGEEQKETEIGLMPKSWDVERVAEVYNFKKKHNKFDIKQHKKIPFIPMEYISEQQRIVDKYDLKEKISSGTFVLKGDLIVAKITPSFENGKQGIVDNIPFEFVYATTEVWPIHNREGESNINFLHYYLKKPDIRNEIAGKMEGSTGRQRVPKNVLENLKIPFPRYAEQVEISGIFISLDAKISQAESKKQSLQALFRTMLNQLMTGKVRVKDFDFEVN